MWRNTLLAACVALTSPLLLAAPNATTKQEIDHLLSYLEKSRCEFNRNGSWYTSVEASKHLRDKYEYLLKKDWVSNAESFIDRAASKSSMTGQAYQVRCSGQQAVASANWLSSELKRWRQSPRS
ncbi:DUF5329 domain-containing protein [Neisseriaceae bacterium TC5R-5]|nr:DUF5329 domain-containing protein [Neisseriaceae bacterium TC5R-5]